MKTKIAKLLFTSTTLLFLCFSMPSQACESKCSKKDDWYQIYGGFEYGFSAIVGHVIQFGINNPSFDFKSEGGQSILFPNWRAALGMKLFQYHTLELIYQPIYLDTFGQSTSLVRFDNVTIAANTPINSRYYFPYYRLSYFYHFVDGENFLLSAGAGIQIRNTEVAFASANGNSRFATTNIGPVPLLTVRLKYTFSNSLWAAMDAGGIWAPIPGLNGSNNPVTGWLYDVAVLGGLDIDDNFSWFLSARLVGGGAQGDGAARASGDQYSYNALNALNFSTGIQFHYAGL